MESIVVLIAQLNAALSETKAALEGLALQAADAQAQLEAVAQAKYDEGFAAGVASVVVPAPTGDKTQEDIDKAVLEATTPLLGEIEALKSRVAELEVAMETKALEAVAAFKATLLAAYDAQQVAESEQETGFKNLLV